MAEVRSRAGRTGGQDEMRFRRRPSTQRSTHHLTVMPSGLAATFTADFDGTDVDIGWQLDTGVLLNAREQLIIERAARELRTAIGDPVAEATTERPAWMGSFLWTPPMQDAGAQTI